MALRAATAELHAQLDSTLPLARADATLADYLQHLGAVGAWLLALTPSLQALDANVAAAMHLSDPTRLNALESDLHDSGHSFARRPSRATQTQMEQALQVHSDKADAVRWGVAYVVEGSQLGGQALYRALATPLSPHPLRYLRGRADDTGARWKVFLATLRAHLQSPDETHAACAGAQAAFRGLQQHLSEMEGITA